MEQTVSRAGTLLLRCWARCQQCNGFCLSMRFVAPESSPHRKKTTPIAIFLLFTAARGGG